MGHIRHLFFLAAPPVGTEAGLQRGVIGDAVQEVADHLARDHRAGFADEDEESRLERIVCIVYVAGDSPADAEDHGTMTADEVCEGVFVA